MQDSHREVTYLAVVIGVFTLMQLIVLLLFGYTPYHDSNCYIDIAQQCIEAGEPYPTTRQIQEVEFIWNMGAIHFSYLSLLLFKSITPLLVLYAFMKGMTAWMVYRIARHLYGKRTAWITLILYVIYPANYGECTSTLTELPFIFFSFLGMIFALRDKTILLGGICMAIANWVRPMGIVFIVTMCAYYLFRRNESKKRMSYLCGAYIATIFLFGSLYYLRTGYFIYQAKTGWMALMQYSWDHDKDKQTDYPLFEHGNPMYYDENQTNAIDRDHIWQQNFLVWLPHNLGEYLSQMPEKLWRTYISDNMNMCTFIPHKQEREYMYEEVSMEKLYADFPHYSPVQVLTIINLAYYYCLLIAFCVVIYMAYRKKQLGKYVIPITITAFGTILLLLVGHGETRFHTTFIPFFMMMAASRIPLANRKNNICAN